jgi:hypothetical protein
MAHYAFIDENSIVVEVITGRNETEVVDGISDWEKYYEEFRPGLTCKRTSYNGNIRKNFAGVGFTYDSTRDAFIAPKIFDSWTLNEDTCEWEAPVPYPTDEKTYSWDETTVSWVEDIPVISAP